MTLGYLPGFSDPPSYTERLLACSGRLAFDVGANAGWVAQKLAGRFEKVVAFEPCRESYDVLAMLTKDTPNLEAVNVAVSDHSGVVTLREAQVTEKWGELVTGDSMPDWGATTGQREVPAVTLDDCLLVYGAPDLVKIDTEGHELAIMRGAAETIRDARPQWWIEIHDHAYLDPISDLLDGYLIALAHHPAYIAGSDEDRRHFYLVATAP